MILLLLFLAFSVQAQEIPGTAEILDIKTFRIAGWSGSIHDNCTSSPDGRYFAMYAHPRLAPHYKEGVIVDLVEAQSLLTRLGSGKTFPAPMAMKFPLKSINQFFFSPNSQYLVTIDGGTRTLRLHDYFFSGKTTLELDFPKTRLRGRLPSVFFTPDGQFLLITTYGKVEIRHTQSPEKVFKTIDFGVKQDHRDKAHLNNILAGFSEDGRFGFLAPRSHPNPFLYLIDFQEPDPFETMRKIETKTSEIPELRGTVPYGPRGPKRDFAIGFSPSGSHIIMQGIGRSPILFIPTTEGAPLVEQELLSKLFGGLQLEAHWFFNEDESLIIYDGFWGKQKPSGDYRKEPQIKLKVDLNTYQAQRIKEMKAPLHPFVKEREEFFRLASQVDPQYLPQDRGSCSGCGFSKTGNVIWWRIKSDPEAVYFHFPSP